jgi:hypothetical protein
VKDEYSKEMIPGLLKHDFPLVAIYSKVNIFLIGAHKNFKFKGSKLVDSES